MSSGACRALAALLLTLVATIGLTLPVAAEEARLNELSRVTYTVDPNTGDVDVKIIVRLESANGRAVPPGTWGPIVVEERATPVVEPKEEYQIVDGSRDLPGPWEAIEVLRPKVDPNSKKPIQIFTISYTLKAATSRDSRQLKDTPARVDAGYVYVCVPGQAADQGTTILKIKNGSRFEIDQSGSILVPNSQGDLQSDNPGAPTDLFTCVEGTRDGQLATRNFPGPDDRTIVLQAWPGPNTGWLDAAEANGQPALDDIRATLGLKIPGEGPIIIREAPARSIGGYASDHDTPGIVQLDENGGAPRIGQNGGGTDPEHEFAHVWFGTDNFLELWLREGLAEWTAGKVSGEVCAPVDSNQNGVDLSDWKVEQPTSNLNTIEEQIAAQEAAACGIVSAMAQRMSDEQWREVLGSMLYGETKYIGSSGPGIASTNVVDYQEWLDAVDERGLVPARQSDPGYTGDVAGLDLDFAQNLIDQFGADVDPVLLEQRSATRARYHQFLIDAAPLGAPLSVRKAMDDWFFDEANAALDKSYEVLDALRDADALLPTAGLLGFIQPAFEGASDDDALEAVLKQTLSLRDSASGVGAPLSQLQVASPEGWSLPMAISEAIKGQRFDEIMAAIGPSLQVVQDVSAANEAMPQAGLLEKYKDRYESTATVTGLQELADEVTDVRAQAQRTATALQDLQTSVGEWQIPDAVTKPLENGQIAAGFAIITDARAVVKAAGDANRALPGYDLSSDIRTRFEAVQDSTQMSTLRADTEVMRDQAQAIGDALGALESQAPEWQLPAVIRTPIDQRDFATAARVAAIAQGWINDAYEANTKLPAMNAIDRAQQDFEQAATEADLKAGAERANNWNIAADRVAEAQAAIVRPRDLLADLGLWGTDLQPILDQAIEAAVDGDSQKAFTQAAIVINAVNSASSDGGLRLAGVIFLGVAIVGVLGLWLMLRREAGPPWARQTKPHWVDDKKDRRLLGRGKKKDSKDKSVKPR